MTQDLDDWRTVHGSLADTAQNQLWLDVFEAAYDINDCRQALLSVPAFLGHFLIRDFDYEGFQQVLSEEDDLERSLDADMQAVASLMLRLVLTIAKTHGLPLEDWQEANAACGKAVRSLPACYRLQRQLPGALNDARALRWLEAEDGPGSSLNPWNTDEGRELFEDRHQVLWSDVKALLAKDGCALGSFSGPLLVLELVHLPALSIAHLQVLHACAALSQGDVVLWEVDAGIGSLLQEGFVIHGQWRQLESEFCFLSAFDWICPDWARGLSEQELTDEGHTQHVDLGAPESLS
ncbi:clcC [Symbiodinium pilosum]|uniref:ClcC protein n=1 Tax=Symbiodinium pilosum TaxID=2952 RepID=A0A812Y0I6_SYMPI|nr:clcC [Symbiodinium pilosum]